MKKTGKKSAVFFAAFMALFLATASACGGDKTPKNSKLNNCGIIHEQEFGGVYIKMTIEDFNALGFSYGDSVDIAFSNGYLMTDIPYYNGYYTRTGEPLLIAYPGYEYIKAAINNGDDLWDVAGLSESAENDMTATVSLNEKGKYFDIQSARDIRYFDDRTLYPSDEVFANFRSLKGGALKENKLYRSASPCDNRHNRAKFVDNLIKKAGVTYIIDLADTDEKIKGYMAKSDFCSDYFSGLYNAEDTENDKVEALALNINFNSEYFKGQVIKAMTAIADNDGIFLIHCTEGKDRTGFLCLLIECFAGATYGEIVEDYMATYFNYYAVTKAFDRNKYETIVNSVLDPMIETIAGHNIEDFESADYRSIAENYLKDGLSEEKLTNLRNNICN